MGNVCKCVFVCVRVVKDMFTKPWAQTNAHVTEEKRESDCVCVRVFACVLKSVSNSDTQVHTYTSPSGFNTNQLIDT